MSPRREQGLGPGELTWFVISVLAAGGLLLYLPDAYRLAGRDAWLLMAGAGLIITIGGALIGVLAATFPGQTVVRYAQAILGRPLGWLLAVALAVYCLVATAITVRITAEVVNSALLARTPTWVIVLVLVATSWYAAQQPILAVARTNVMLAPALLFLGLGAVLTALENFNPLHVQPVLTNHLGPILQAMAMGIAQVPGIEVLYFFMAHVAQPGKAARSAALGAAIMGAAVAVSALITVGVLGASTPHYSFPILDAVKAAHLPGGIVERLETLFLVTWIVATYTRYCTLFTAAVSGFTELVGIPERRLVSLPLAAVAVLLALIPSSQQAARGWAAIVTRASVVTGFWLALLLVLVARWRTAGGIKT